MNSPLTLLQHLRTDNTPFILKCNGAPPEWQDELLHRDACQQNPQLYAMMGAIESVRPWQKVRILFQLLQSSRRGISVDTRNILNRVTDLLLAILPSDRVLTIFLALRRVRANHKHTTRTILNYILNHPQLANLIVCRRHAVVDCLEHALGKDVARACLQKFAPDAKYLHRNLLRFARQPEAVKPLLRRLYHTGMSIAGYGNYKIVHADYVEKLDAKRERPKTVTATNRGDIAATLVHLYRGGQSLSLQEALQTYVAQATEKLPKYRGKMALIFDASASTRSYGEREYCTLAQSVALKMVLERCCDRMQLYPVGGNGNPIQPEGQTDLALALLDALKDRPDLVAIISDGYENIYPGDLAKVIATLPQTGIETAIAFCHSKFTNADDLSLRCPAPALPQLEFWHQDDFEDLLLSLFAMTSGSDGESCLQEFLLDKLSRTEKELKPWTASN